MLYRQNSIRSVFRTVYVLGIDLGLNFSIARRGLTLYLKRIASSSQDYQKVRFTYHTLRKLKRLLVLFSFSEVDDIIGVPYNHRDYKLYSQLAMYFADFSTFYDHWKTLEGAGDSIESVSTVKKFIWWSKISEEMWDTAFEHFIGRNIGLCWTGNFGLLKSVDPQEFYLASGESEKAVYTDIDSNYWICKYDTESLFNPVLVSMLGRLLECPGTEIITSRIAYDHYVHKPCSIQNYVPGAQFTRFCSTDTQFYQDIVGQSTRKSIQLVCQSVLEYLVGNIDGFQALTFEDNIVLIDQDRSFFFHLGERQCDSAFRCIIKSLAHLPEVIEALDTLIRRIESVPEIVFGGLLARSSNSANRISSLVYFLPFEEEFNDEFERIRKFRIEFLIRKRNVRFLIENILAS